MSKARAKGSGWETELKERHLSTVWPTVERAPLRGTNDFGDFVNVDGLLIEAKKVDSPRFLEWARKAKGKAGEFGWRIVWSGDRRRGDGPYVMLPLRDWLDLEEDAKAMRDLIRDIESALEDL